jgi:hypothetical protein
MYIVYKYLETPEYFIGYDEEYHLLFSKNKQDALKIEDYCKASEVLEDVRNKSGCYSMCNMKVLRQ